MKPTTFALFVAACTLPACESVGEDYVSPLPEATAPVVWNGRLDGIISTEDLDPATLAKWWATLQDPILTELIERAVDANLDLKVAEAQLSQARAQRVVAAASGAPQVGATGTATRSGSSQNAGVGATSDLYTAGLDASWELDVFGGIRRTVEAAEADLQAAEEGRRDVLVTIIAEVALNYADLRTQENRLVFTERNLELQRQSLEIVQAQFDEGVANNLDLSRAKAQFRSTEADVPSLRRQIEATRNRICVLLGQAPGALDATLTSGSSLPVPNIRVAVGVPAEVLRRRPDVRLAERRLAAASARTGVAVADLYPKFSLAGSIGLESLSVSSLFESASRAFTLGPRIQWSPFNGGRLRAQVEISEAVEEETLVNYEQAVLLALEEVQNAITAYTEEHLRRESLIAATEAASDAANLARARFDAGATNFLSVLDAQRELAGAQDALALNEGEITAGLVRLYKALGGGWDPETPSR